MANQKQANPREELRWFLNRAEGDACGLKAGHYRVLSATPADAAAAGEQGYVRGQSRGEKGGIAGIVRDFYPEERQPARRRLLRAYRAFSGLATWQKAVLEAVFTDTRETDGYLGVNHVHLELVSMFRPVVEASRKCGRTRLQCAREYVSARGTDAVNGECLMLVEDALGAFALEMSK